MYQTFATDLNQLLSRARAVRITVPGYMPLSVEEIGSTVQDTVPNTIPNFIRAMSNGVGGATTVTYTPSTQWPNQQLPFPVQTVSGIAICDNWNSGTSTCSGMNATTTYSYTGGYHQISERDFRGFKTAVVTSPGASDADKTVTTTWFHQGNELTPIDTENPGLANGYMKGKPYRVEVRRKSDSLLYAKTETTYLADQIGTDTTAPWFNPPAQVDSSLCDGGPCATTRVTFVAADYDAYGNVLRESHHGDINMTGDEKTVQRTFLANTTDYVVSMPARETIYKGLSVAAVDRLSETLFYYDGTGTGTCTAAPTGSNTAVTKGKLTKVERWLNSGTNPISGMEYDSTTGVLLCSRDPLGNKTTLTYDPTKTFVLTSTNQLGHVTTTVHSGVNGVAIDPATGFYGTVKSMTDPNGKIVSHEYDALGRKTKTTAPDGLVTTVTYPTLAEYGVIGTQKITTTMSGASLPTNLVSSTFFDGLGRTMTEESSGPTSTTLVTKTEYDVKGQVFRTSLPYFKTTESVTNRWRTMTYDALGRVTQVTHPDTLSGTSLTSKSCYAPFVTVTLDPSGARKRETKDAYGRIVKIEEYSSTTSTCDTAVGTVYATTNYTYDLLGNLIKVVDALGIAPPCATTA
jgi:YD repeat-containing protein